MKKSSVYFVIFIFLLAACNPNKNEKEQTSDSDVDAARNFIQAALKGNFTQAKGFMLDDSANEERLDAVSRIPRSPDEKQGLWDASINIHSRKLINDSTSIIVYSNSFYKNRNDTLRIIKNDGKWLVDFKYLFEKK